MPQLLVDKLTRKISIHLFNGMRIIFSPGLGNILGCNEREDVINVYGMSDTVVTLKSKRYVQHRRQLPVSICVL